MRWSEARSRGTGRLKLLFILFLLSPKAAEAEMQTDSVPRRFGTAKAVTHAKLSDGDAVSKLWHL